MALYRPIRTTDTAIPDAIADIRGDLAQMSAATSGQINGTVRKLHNAIEQLAEQVRLTPAVHARHAEITDWVSTSPGSTQITLSMTVPSGKSRCQVFVGACGICQSDGIHANEPAFRIDIGNTKSPVLPMIPDNMDSWHLIGQYSGDVAVTAGQTITVRLVFIRGTLYAGTNYIHKASLDAFFAFTG